MSGFVWKLALETIAESGRRGGAGLAARIVPARRSWPGPIRIDPCDFDDDSNKHASTIDELQRVFESPETIEVGITLVHMPPPGPVSKLLDVASVGLQAIRSVL